MSSSRPTASPHASVQADANQLIHESSPYLLQHAHNPVDWRAWGPDAFDAARREHKPIFLSVGYSTCYWCHVMERQSFEDEAIAAKMNEHFICVKVDREERPDVDELYMTAVQAMTGSGGWPMSVFLTPPAPRDQFATDADAGTQTANARSDSDASDSSAARSDQEPVAGEKGGYDLKPFFAGTYFPPQDMHGRPGLPTVLEKIADAWRDQRDQVLEQAQRVADAVTDHLTHRRAEADRTLSSEPVSAAATRLMRAYDATHGGFGQAPKFPQPSNLMFLMELGRHNDHDHVQRALCHTFDRMARGGMYDQLRGGFHRYSTDDQWLVPHFEKMLYDQGQLVEAYARAIPLLGEPQAAEPQAAKRRSPSQGAARHADEPASSGGRDRVDVDEGGDASGASDRVPAPEIFAEQARRVVRESCRYVIEQMVDPTGAFWSAQDAEVDAREGGSYVWTVEQVRSVLSESGLGESSIERALEMYGLDAGPNFRDPHDPDSTPANVLHLPAPLHALQGLDPSPADFRDRVNAALLAARDRRKQPATDDKVLASWNGLMIAGLAIAGRTLNEPDFIAAAERAADAVLERMVGQAGGLLRTMRGGEAKIEAFLEDYAFLIHGLIELHRATGDSARLDAARRLDDQARERFDAIDTYGGGYFDTTAEQTDLFVRLRSTFDGALPTGASRMIHNLIDFYELTGERDWLDRAERDLRSFAEPLQRSGAAMAHMQHALLRWLSYAEPASDQHESASSTHAESSPNASVSTDAAARKTIAVDVSESNVDLSKGRGRLTVILRIGPEYHVNAHRPSDPALTPTSIELEGLKHVALDVSYPPPARRKYPFADEAIDVYEGRVELEVTLTPTGPVEAGQGVTPRLTLTFQMCTEQSCLAPRTLELPVRIEW